MKNLAKIFKGFFSHVEGNQTNLSMTKLTRNQAGKLLNERMKPVLEMEGFLHQKGFRFWRITTNKTDVIELRFLLNNDPATSGFPLSSFSILSGCYFNFIPNAFDEKILHQLPNTITPDETHCHLRFTGVPNFQQSIFKGKSNWWHLECDEIETSRVLSDVCEVLSGQLLPLMNRFESIENLLNLLESQDPSDINIGIGKPDSFDRQYLLAFVYLKLGDKKSALKCLHVAKEIQDALLRKTGASIKLNTEAPIMKQSRIISEAIDSLV